MKVWVLLVLALAGTPQEAPPQSALEDGLRQYREGLLDQAVVTLDGFIRRAPSDGSRDLVTAYLHKGAALVGLQQEEQAKIAFRHALAIDPALRIRKGDFPDRVIRVFDAARTGKTSSVMERPSEAPKKAGIGTAGILAIVGGAAALAGAATKIGPGPDPSTGPSSTAPQARGNQPPTVTVEVNSQGGDAIQGVTNVSFTATGRDPDGDSLTYSWNFGDGENGTGATTSHIFHLEGTRGVTVTVTDGRGGSASGTGQVRVGHLNGVWSMAGRSGRFDLSQNSTRITGQYIGDGGHRQNVNGTATDPRRVRFSFRCGGDCFFQDDPITYSYSCDPNPNLTAMSCVERGEQDSGRFVGETAITLVR